MEPKEAERLPTNVPGKYYVTDECNGCAYCASVAPENFDFDKSTNTYYVSKQPVDDAEEEVVEEATNDCPIDAIRVDGIEHKDEYEEHGTSTE
jgi:ferredoxin